MRVAVPRDWAGSFDPVLVPKQARRSDGLDAVIISLYEKVISSPNLGVNAVAAAAFCGVLSCGVDSLSEAISPP